MSQNAILPTGESVAERVAQQTLARRSADYTDEVRRILDAALEVMAKCGTTSRPRVADIVAAAGVSNEAFYRHFGSKDALVEALLDDGTERLASYLGHQMEKASAPEEQIARWVEGVLAQADPEIAATTLAVLWNGSSVGEGPAAGRHFASAPVAVLLQEPFAALGCSDPAMFATLAAHAILGRLSDHLWQRSQPSPAEVGQMIEFCITAATAG